MFYFENSYILEIYTKMFTQKMIWYMEFASEMIWNRGNMRGYTWDTLGYVAYNLFSSIYVWKFPNKK